MGTTFQISDSTPKVQIGYGEEGIALDSSGTFHIAGDRVYNGALVAVGEDGAVGFTVVPKSGKVTIRLQPPVKLQLSLKRRTLLRGEGASLQFFAGSSIIGYGFAKWGDSSLSVPRGSRLTVNEVASVSENRVIKAPSNNSVALQIELKPTKWAKYLGVRAPTVFQTDSNRPFDWKSVKGKWVLLDFWATWCKPCITDLKEVVEFYDKNKELSDQFEIVAVHSPDAKSFSERKSAIEEIVKAKWGGIEPKFPLLFDASGKTVSDWGVMVYPSTFLIDPEGNLVGLGSLEDLKAKIKGIKPKN